MTLLTISHLSKRYGETEAVRGVDLEIPAGSRTAVVGSSGCGKTTLLRLIAGFETPDQGKVVLGGTTLIDEQTFIPAHRRSIGYVAQEGALFPHLTVAANVGFGLDRKAPDRDKRIAELMERVELPLSMLDRRPHELSGGQQQRVALARALARRPRLMLLDEPFSALDAGLRESMREMVGTLLSKAGITTVLVTHDQAEALSFAEHLVVMRDGAVIQTGAPQQIYLKPADAITASFLGEAIFLDAELADGVALCDFGRIQTDAPGRHGRARLMLRPEQIQMVPIASDTVSDQWTTSGRVVSRAYRGPTCRVVVQPPSRGYPAGPRAEISLVTSSLFTLELGAFVRLDVNGTAHVLG
jgi:iron(III) transport system ATP-binding protein